MPRPRTRPLLEEFDRIPVKSLFLGSDGIPGRVNVKYVSGVEIRYWTDSDDNGVIEAGGKSWFAEYVPRSRWSSDRPGYSVDEFFAHYLLHANGKRHCDLLVGENGLVGTRTELRPIYHSQRIYCPKTRIGKRAAIIRRLMLNNRPDDLSLVYVPMPKNPKHIHRDTWERRCQRELGQKQIVPVRKPYGMHIKQFKKMLRHLNKPHRPRNKGDVGELDSLGLER
jgi:hypothetical protein